MQLFGFHGLPFQTRFKVCNLCIAISLVTFCILVGSLLIRHGSHSDSSNRPRRTVVPVQLNDIDWSTKFTCFFHTCFEINECVFGIRDRIGVHVLPKFEFISNWTSRSYTPEYSNEYSQLLSAIRQSSYYQRNASKACVIVPPIDTLSQSKLDQSLTSVLLNSLPDWNGGRNHLIFNMLPGSYPNFSTTPDFYYGKAMLAGGGFSRESYRQGFDISIPVFNPVTRSEKFCNSAMTSSKRSRLLTVLSHGLYSTEFSQKLLNLASSEGGAAIVILEACPTSHDILPSKRCSSTTGEEHMYPDVLEQSQFCLLLPGVRHGSPDFTDAMMTGCIPVVLGDAGILPFSEVLDWGRASVRVWSHDLDHITEKLRGIPPSMVTDMKEQVLFLHKHYFSSMASIAMATLHIINGRVFPTAKYGYEWWNNQNFDVKITDKFQYSYPSPIVLPAPPPSEGFTAVILTFDRVPMLFDVIRNVAAAPSLAKILVIWNNVNKPPPPVNQWPRIRKPIQVIRSKQNKLSNRFIPYTEIQTAAVVALDDDITMLTADELEFGYKAWREFPTRLVGYPGRVHSYNHREHKWRYESIWLNNISLVLTGAAFYHKFYHYLFSSVMPREIRDWVDYHMNCEDIAMNFLIANYTGLPPMKVSPRKKFKCSSCTSEESLWSDPQHYQERDKCINIFEQFFGGMPLRSVKYRLDPVLYKDPVEDQFKSYPNMGDL